MWAAILAFGTELLKFPQWLVKLFTKTPTQKIDDRKADIDKKAQEMKDSGRG